MKLEADRAKVTTQEENDKLTAELRKLTALESELKGALDQVSANSMAAKETKEQVAKLKLQLKQALKKSAIYQKLAVQLDLDMVTLEEENEELKKLITTNTKADEDNKALKLRLETMKKACEEAKLAGDRAENEIKNLTYERAEFWRRIEGLEAEKLAFEKADIERLAEKEQRAPSLSSIKFDLQVAQQQIWAMNNHIEFCPFAQNTGFWDECLRVSREGSQLLGISSSSSDESPTESCSHSQITPSTSCRLPSRRKG
ncbi:hypothetical protein F4679DRAFT_567927 [Xylaria curta]|nr:hypothetical protein F4679DRAFT_567927 [Xylaria curta]